MVHAASGRGPLPTDTVFVPTALPLQLPCGRMVVVCESCAMGFQAALLHKVEKAGDAFQDFLQDSEECGGAEQTATSSDTPVRSPGVLRSSPVRPHSARPAPMRRRSISPVAISRGSVPAETGAELPRVPGANSNLILNQVRLFVVPVCVRLRSPSCVCNVKLIDTGYGAFLQDHAHGASPAHPSQRLTASGPPSAHPARRPQTGAASRPSSALPSAARRSSLSHPSPTGAASRPTSGQPSPIASSNNAPGSTQALHPPHPALAMQKKQLSQKLLRMSPLTPRPSDSPRLAQQPDHAASQESAGQPPPQCPSDDTSTPMPPPAQPAPPTAPAPNVHPWRKQMLLNQNIQMSQKLLLMKPLPPPVGADACADACGREGEPVNPPGDAKALPDNTAHVVSDKPERLHAPPRRPAGRCSPTSGSRRPSLGGVPEADTRASGVSPSRCPRASQAALRNRGAHARPSGSATTVGTEKQRAEEAREKEAREQDARKQEAMEQEAREQEARAQEATAREEEEAKKKRDKQEANTGHTLVPQGCKR